MTRSSLRCFMSRRPSSTKTAKTYHGRHTVNLTTWQHSPDVDWQLTSIFHLSSSSIWNELINMNRKGYGQFRGWCSSMEQGWRCPAQSQNALNQRNVCSTLTVLLNHLFGKRKHFQEILGRLLDELLLYHRWTSTSGEILSSCDITIVHRLMRWILAWSSNLAKLHLF